MYKLFVSLRYLRARTISYIAIGALALGVATLIIVTSVMGGFQREFHKKIRGTLADVSVESRNFFGIRESDGIEARIAKHPRVRGTAPFLENIVLIDTEFTKDYGFLKGIDPAKEPAVGDFASYLLSPREIVEARYETSPAVLRLMREQLEEMGPRLEIVGRDDVGRPRRVMLGASPVELGAPTPSAVVFPAPAKKSAWVVRALPGSDVEVSREPLAPGAERLLVPGDTILAGAQGAIFADETRKPEASTIFRTRSGLPGLLVGVQLFTFMKMDVGDKVTLATTTSVDKERFEEKDVRKMDFEVVGAFKTGMFEQDKRFLYANLADVQRFLDVPGRLSGINVKVDDYSAANEIARGPGGIQEMLQDPSLYVLPWNMRNENLIRAVATERWMIGFIVFFMIALAGLNLTAILTMMVIEKTKDLGILGAVGATRGGLFSIFLLQGGYIAFFGSILGAVFGYVFVTNINWIDRNVMARILGHPIFDPEVYYLDQIPTEVDVGTILICAGATIVLGFALAVYPAYRASRLEPMEALRYE